MVNKAILIGNLGQDPEQRTTNGGLAVVNLSLATSSRHKDQTTGEWAEKTEWHRVVCFGKTAENVGKYCQKGRQIYVEGRLQTRKWEDKEGRPRSTTEIVADNVKFLGSRTESAGHTDYEPRRSGNTQGPQGGGGYGDGIPF